MGIEPFLVSSVMLISIAQRLVRKVCPHCREPYSPPTSALEALGITTSEDDRFAKGRGCVNCMETGYKSRTGLYEVLIIDEMVQDMVLQGKSAQEITRATRRTGTLRTLKEDAVLKVRQGTTTIEEALSAVMV